MLFNSGYHGLIYIGTFSLTNITFVVSIQNTNVANTLVMIATAPMISAILGAIFLKEPPDKKTWISIIITFLAIIYIFLRLLKIRKFLWGYFRIYHCIRFSRWCGNSQICKIKESSACCCCWKINCGHFRFIFY